MAPESRVFPRKAGGLVARDFNFVLRYWWGTVHIFSITKHVGHIQAETCQRYNIIAIAVWVRRTVMFEFWLYKNSIFLGIFCQWLEILNFRNLNFFDSGAIRTYERLWANYCHNFYSWGISKQTAGCTWILLTLHQAMRCLIIKWAPIIVYTSQYTYYANHDYLIVIAISQVSTVLIRLNYFRKPSSCLFLWCVLE